MSDLPTPNTRKEQYLNAIATGNPGDLPTPITREEEYLDAIAKSGGGSGDGDMKKSVYDSDLAVANAGGIGAFVSDAISDKVDKVEGKGLSTNDYDNTEKGKVADNAGAIEAIVNVTGAKNVLPFDLAKIKTVNVSGTWSGDVYTKNGISFDCSKDGVVSIYGTATNTVGIELCKFIDTSSLSGMVLNGVPSGTVSSTLYLRLMRYVDPYTIYAIESDGEDIVIPSMLSDVQCDIIVENGVTIPSNAPITIKPMIRPAGTDGTYVPYAMTNRELTERTEKSIAYSGALDNLFKPGFYITASGVTNTPNDSDYHFINNGLFVSGNGTNYCCQMIIDTRNQLYIRVCNNGTWANWSAYIKS